MRGDEEGGDNAGDASDGRVSGLVTSLLFAYEAPVTHFSFLSRNTTRLAQCKDDMAEDSDSLM